MKHAAKLALVGLASIAVVGPASSQSNTSMIGNALGYYNQVLAAKIPSQAAAEAFKSAFQTAMLSMVSLKPWQELWQYFRGQLGSGYRTGGGGASGSWTFDDRCRFNFNLDAQGNFIVPSMPLSPSPPITASQPWTYYVGRGSPPDFAALREGTVVQGGVETSGMLIGLHDWNRHYYGTIEDGWLGVYKVTHPNPYGGKVYYSRSVSYIDGNSGNVVPARGQIWEEYKNSYWSFYHGQYGGTNMKCPVDTVSGGTFHYYAIGSSISSGSTCLMYDPDNNVSESGYAYNPRTTIPSSELANFPNDQPWLKNCRLSKAALIFLTNRIAEKACGKEGPDCPRLKEEDIPEPGIPLEEIQKTIGDPPANPTPPPTAPEPTPTPTPTYDPDEGPPPQLNEPVAPPWSPWMPSLPAINLSFPTECPTYSFEAFERTFVLDTHCQFIEMYRAVIAGVMILIFTIGAFLIVLRA